MLQSAAPAGAEMLADRLRALVAGLVNTQQMPTVGMTRNALDGDGFSGKCIGHIGHAVGSVGDAVATVAEPRNNQLFSHGRPQAGIRYCRRRP